MLTDTLIKGTTAVSFVRRTPLGGRSKFVPSGDTPANERKVEVSHEVTATRRVNTLEKVSLTRPNPANAALLEELSVALVIKRPASATEAEIQLLVNQLYTPSGGIPGHVTKLYNQES